MKHFNQGDYKMTNKHTQGPWSVFDDGGDNFGIIRYADGTPISTPEGCAMDGEVLISDLGIKDKANARLIAAAPELLEALELCISKDMLSGEALDKAKEAIAKAKGQ